MFRQRPPDSPRIAKALRGWARGRSGFAGAAARSRTPTRARVADQLADLLFADEVVGRSGVASVPLCAMERGACAICTEQDLHLRMAHCHSCRTPFHYGCLSQWLTSGRSAAVNCAVCRARLVPRAARPPYGVHQLLERAEEPIANVQAAAPAARGHPAARAPPAASLYAGARSVRGADVQQDGVPGAPFYAPYYAATPLSPGYIRAMGGRSPAYNPTSPAYIPTAPAYTPASPSAYGVGWR